MARVVFFLERLPPTDDLVGQFAYALIEALSEQGHEMFVLSTAAPGHPGPPPKRNISVAFPFKKWNWVEAARAALPALSFQPDAFHFVQPHRESLGGWTNATSVLAAAARAAGIPVVASFFDLRGKWREQHRALLAQANGITAASQAQLDALMGQVGGRALGAVAPLSWIEEHPRADDRETAAAGDSLSPLHALGGLRLALAPGDVDSHDPPETLFAIAAQLLTARRDVAFGVEGGWGGIAPRHRFRLLESLPPEVRGRFALLGARSPVARADAWDRAEIIVAATLGLETLAIAKFAQDALKQNGFWLAPPFGRHLDDSADFAVAALGDRAARAESMAPELMVQRILRELERGPSRPAFQVERAQAALSDSPANTVSRMYAALSRRN